ncbi:MAG: ATPase, T2SS/T4P/T4SS family [Candidatus Diapherotrites archaeon]|nr:ATPase, T2SS/T4P/T4SS family [Candidatus Diapherotrites archaeon]
MPELKEAKGKMLHGYGGVRIFEGFPYNFYEILPSPLNEQDMRLAALFIKVIGRQASLNALLGHLGSAKKDLIEQFRRDVIQPVDVNEMVQHLPSPKQLQDLQQALSSIAVQLKVAKPELFAQFVLDSSIGYKQLAPLLDDDQLEEVMVNGAERNVFVFHRKAGNCKTSIRVQEQGFVLEIIKRIAATVNKQFNEAHPLLDARLPDGSRANATFSYVSPFGHTLTIRKFTRVPLSIVNLIENNTITSELAALLWVMVEGLRVYPMNLIITGGAGTGKTTFMNILAMFIPFSERIISIEDTVELDLGGRENWIQLESKPRLHDLEAVSMDELLRNTLRMRPDRIVVGEVRGEEAQTLFVAMDTGHRGILGTVHSNTAREMMLRLRSAPMNVPEQMLPLLDLVVVMQRNYDRKKGMLRRVKHVAEISRMDEKVLLSNIFELDEKNGMVERTNIPSHVVETLAERAGMTKNELRGEMMVRQRIIEFLLAKGIAERSAVESVIQQYYFDPESVLKQVAGLS